MSGDTPHLRAAAMSFDPNSRFAIIQKLITEGLFDKPTSSKDVAQHVSERSGKRLKTTHVQTYLAKFQQADVLRSIKLNGVQGNFWVIASLSRADAARLIGKSEKIVELRAELFSAELKKKLESYSKQEMGELEDVFGQHGNCTAFLLRKILEKLIIIAFAKNGKEALLEDAARPGGFKSLEAMIEIAAREKHGGVPFLTGKTAKETKGTKFLGDTAAHNPKVSVKMETIVPQMPYIITAYEELAALL